MQNSNVLAALRKRRPSSVPGRYQRGMTLVEWMVSITISLILLTGLVALIGNQSRTQAELEKSSRQIENGRYAMQLLQEDVQLAGYYGEFSSVSSLAVPGALPNPCLTTATGSPSLADALPFPVQGYDAPGATLPTDFAGCPLNAANHLPGTDILVVRRVDTQVFTGNGDLVPGQVYFQAGLTASHEEFKYVLAAAAGTSADWSVFNLQQKDPTSTTQPPAFIPAGLRKYLVHIYFLSPCSVPANGSTCSAANTDDGGVSIPTLKRLELGVSGGAAQFATVPLVEGIENLQIDYGFDVAAPSGDGAPDSYATDATAVSDWANVMALRLNVLARNNERTPGYRDTKTYNLGLAGTTTATNDDFKRRMFTQVIRVINQSGRRDR